MHAGNLEFVVSCAFASLADPGQQNLPILKTNSTSIDVQDGVQFRKGHWSVDPDLELDIYYAQRSRHAKTIKFISDVDSISFQVTPGQDQDFLIQVPDGRRARTRISTLRRPLRWLNSSPPPAPLTIPFTIGPDNKMHIQGRMNDSAPLDFMFDTGAVANIVIFKSAIDKVPGLSFDGTIVNEGAGGSATRRTSNDNRLEVSGLCWDQELVMQIRQGRDAADGIIVRTCSKTNWLKSISTNWS